MKRARTVPPTRLVDLPLDHDLAKLGVLVESVPPVPPAKLPLVKWRIRSTLRRQAEWRRRVLRVVVVGALLFLAGGVVGAMVQPVLLSKLRARIETIDVSDSPPRTPRRHSPVAHQTPALAATSPKGEVCSTAEAYVATPEAGGTSFGQQRPATEARSVVVPVASLLSNRTVASRPPVGRSARAPSASEMPKADRATATPAVAEPTPFLSSPQAAPAVALVPPPVTAAPPVRAMTPPSGEPSRPLGPVLAPAVAAPAASPESEQALLAKALRALRNERDPQGALVFLDGHRNRFSHGSLAPEAARLRTWALLLSGRGEDALAEIERQSSVASFARSGALPGSDEYHVLRGELQARAGRWRAALGDFESALQASATSAIANGNAIDSTVNARMERALWGRASARSHLGDHAGARADLRDYLVRFPRGRFSSEAARLMSGEHRP